MKTFAINALLASLALGNPNPPSRSSTASSTASAAASTSTPGYFTDFTTQPGNNFTFGQHYAVLNFDLINGLVSGVATTPQGQKFIASTSKWINTVHQQNPPPLSIFTRIFFSNSKTPELGPDTPFAKAVAGVNLQPNSPESQLFPAFVPLPDYDVVLQKNRYYAGFGNELEEILSTQKIDTVIISGIRTSGVVLSTTYRLFDLNYKVYVIGNNSIETPPNTPDIDRNLKQGVIAKLPADVITVEQAIDALGRSGPAIYY